MSKEKKTREELLKLAEDVAHGHVFTSAHLGEEDSNLLPNIFMILALMSKEDHEKFVKNNPSLLYEYYDKAGPRGINGYPSFMSMRYLNKEEHTEFNEIYKKLHEAMQTAKTGILKGT